MKIDIAKALYLWTTILACWFLLSVLCTGLYLLHGYPKDWDRVVPSMTRQEVLNFCGESPLGGWDMKGHTFRHATAWGGWEIDVDRDVNGNVSHTLVKLRLNRMNQSWLPIRVDGSVISVIRCLFFEWLVDCNIE
jgi:hypothetical protein